MQAKNPKYQPKIVNFFGKKVSPKVRAHIQSQLSKRYESKEKSDSSEFPNNFSSRIKELEKENGRLKEKFSDVMEDKEIQSAHIGKLGAKLKKCKELNKNLLGCTPKEGGLFSDEKIAPNWVLKLNRIPEGKCKDRAFLQQTLLAIHDGKEEVLATLAIRFSMGCTKLTDDKIQTIERLYLKRLNSCCKNVTELNERFDRKNILIAKILSDYRSKNRKRNPEDVEASTANTRNYVVNVQQPQLVIENSTPDLDQTNNIVSPYVVEFMPNGNLVTVSNLVSGSNAIFNFTDNHQNQ